MQALETGPLAVACLAEGSAACWAAVSRAAAGKAVAAVAAAALETAMAAAEATAGAVGWEAAMVATTGADSEAAAAVMLAAVTERPKAVDRAPERAESQAAAVGLGDCRPGQAAGGRAGAARDGGGVCGTP